MHVPRHFEEKRPAVLADLIRKYPFATVVATGDDGPIANHVPLELDAEGNLRGHVARGNELVRHDGARVLAIFHGPHAYVSPNWYPGKREDARVVPTWNYAVVHVYGRLRTITDHAWLMKLLHTLTDRHEAAQPEPWKVADAPADYVERELDAIVGFEIEVARTQGKFKLSQNQLPANHAGVIDGLTQRGDGHDAALAELMSRRDEDPKR